MKCTIPCIVKLKQKVGPFVLAVALVPCLIAYLWTGRTAAESASQQSAASSHALVDLRPIYTAYFLQSLAATAAEQELATQAVRYADHEVDQSFSSALRQAQLVSSPSAESKALESLVEELEATVAKDQSRVQSLTQNKTDNQDELDVAKAELQLDQDELSDALEDLARTSGDIRRQIQDQLTQYESGQKQKDSESAVAQSKPILFISSGITLASHVKDLWQLKLKLGKISEAIAQTNAAVAADTARLNQMKSEHDSLYENTSSAQHVDSAGGKKSAIERLTSRHRKEQLISIYDDKVQTLQSLSSIYSRWREQVILNQLHVAWHRVLGTLSILLGVILAAYLGLQAVSMIYGKSAESDRRLLTTEIAYKSAIRIVGVVAILLVLFGVPNQVATVLALTGAGLTVALKDYIVGFFGWFTLVGRKGIRVGDWVEINGIAGEVIDIGLLRTVLLETSQWSSSGRPTGRKVTFANSFAVEGHYFNFTTSDKWMWDEIEMPVPANNDPYETAEIVRNLVADQTATTSSSAEREWQLSRHPGNVVLSSAAPSVDVKPTSSGMNLTIRFVTDASGRHQLRSKIYESIIRSVYEELRVRGKEKSPDVTANLNLR